MSNRQGGTTRGTTYIGTKAIQPPDTHIRDRNPNQYDTNGYSILDLWLNKVTEEIWILVSLEGNSTSKGQLATWIQFGGGGGGAVTYIANIGNATEMGGFLNVLGVSDGAGNTGARTNAAGDTINIEITPVSFDGDAGTATPANDTINIVGGSGISTSAVGNTVTITAASGISSVPTDSGTAVPAGGVLQIKTNRLTKEAGSTVFFRGAGNEVVLEVTDPDANTVIGDGAGSLTATGLANTVLGDTSVPTLTSGSFNTVVGAISGILTTGSRNTFIGEEVGGAITTGSDSIMIGRRAGRDCTTGTESSNIYIGNLVGADNESNAIRIGVQGNGAGQQNAAYIAGIYGATIGSINGFVKVDSNGKLGSTASAPSDFTLISTQNPTGVTSVEFLNLTGSIYKIAWFNVAVAGYTGGGDVSARNIFIEFFYSNNNGASWTIMPWQGMYGPPISLALSFIADVPDVSNIYAVTYHAGELTCSGVNNAVSTACNAQGNYMGRARATPTTTLTTFADIFGIAPLANVNAFKFQISAASYPGVTFNTGTFSLYEISV